MEKNAVETIEFFVPTLGEEIDAYLTAGQHIGVHHIARYQWAKTIVPKKGKLLDIACGAGYGTAVIAKANPELECLGVDYDERAIAYAREHYALPNLRFEKGNLVTWAIESGAPLGTFDCITSFDTIEHLLHREVAISNIAENLNDDGCLLFSTPIVSEQPLLNPAWEHHKIEYSARFLHGFMQRFFKLVQIPDDGTLPNIGYWKALNADDEIYWNKMNPIACYNPIKFTNRHL